MTAHTEALQAGFQERGRPGEMYGEWMQREIAERRARGEEPPWNLGPTNIQTGHVDPAPLPYDDRTVPKARLFEMQNAAIALAKDNERLRALIFGAEYAKGEIEHNHDETVMLRSCPWCDGGDHHRPDCPAFSAPGVVR